MHVEGWDNNEKIVGKAHPNVYIQDCQNFKSVIYYLYDFLISYSAYFSE